MSDAGEDIKEKLAGDREQLAAVEDETPETWINEELWKKVFFKGLGYLAWILGGAIITVGGLGFDSISFWIGVKMMILPLIWSAFEAQADKKENQRRLKELVERKQENKAHKEELDQLDTENDRLKEEILKKDEELYRVRADLDAKCTNVEVLRNSIEMAQSRISELEKKA